jgi:hypothetical protein
LPHLYNQRVQCIFDIELKQKSDFSMPYSRISQTVCRVTLDFHGKLLGMETLFISCKSYKKFKDVVQQGVPLKFQDLQSIRP